MSKYLYPDDKLPTPQNLKLLALVGDGKKVLEVGCALGYQTRSLKELQRCSVVGIEIDGDAAASAAAYCDQIIVGDIESLDLAKELTDRKFDVITFADVLEHLKNPVQTLERMHQYLEPGGYILASIPNIAHASIVFEMAQGRFDYRDLGLLDNTHIRFFTRQTIYKTFEAAGYCITSLDRNIAEPHSTEFETQIITNEDEIFLKYIKERNPEFNTYQFILKAAPLTDQKSILSELIASQEKLRVSTINIEQQTQKIKKLQSDLDWIENSLPYKTFCKIKRFFTRN